MTTSQDNDELKSKNKIRQDNKRRTSQQPEIRQQAKKKH